MAENKTKPTVVNVDAFIDSVANPGRQADARVVLDMMARVTGEPPRMWGPSIIGFGSYHYRYDSGREGDMCRIGFSPRAANIVLYIMPGFAEEGARLATLGKHKIGKSCLYVNRLTDVDLTVLEVMVRDAWEWMNARYPAE